MNPLGFSACHLQTEMVFLLLSSLDAFYFLSLLIALASTSSAVWSRSGEGGTLVLFPILVGQRLVFLRLLTGTVL